MQNISAKARYTRAKILYKQALALPKTIIDKEDYKEENEDNFRQKRLGILFEAQELTLETRSYIKINYTADSEYLGWVHRIYYTSEAKGYVMNEFNDYHNKHWQEGRKQIISLLSNILSEEKERAKMEELMIDKTLPLKYAGAGIAVMIALFAIWLAPAETMEKIFSPANFFVARISMSTCVALVFLAVFLKEVWKQAILAGIFAILVASLPFVKTDKLARVSKVLTDSSKAVKLKVLVKKDSVSHERR